MTSGLAAPGVSPRFLGLLAAEGLDGKRVLDVGCGWGRLALALAPLAGHVVGLDRDAALIAEARQRARAAGLARVEFQEADVETAEYGRWAPDVVTAHLCASGAIIDRAGRALPPGGCLGMVSLHVDRWRETGRVSRFAYDEAGMERALRAAGLEPEVLEVEREVEEFGSAEEALARVAGLQTRWKADGRWSGYRAFLEAGGRTLTRSQLIVTARRG